MSDIVIVYYSRTGRTRIVAEKLSSLLGADLEEIRESKDRSGVLGFIVAGKDTMTNKPAELTSTHNLEGRRVVVVGMPVWANSPPPAVWAYLDAVDVGGKAVAAFCTHNGGGAAKLLDKLAAALPSGLCETIDFKKPSPDDPGLLARLKDWADRIKGIGQ
jgi:flavodoxin